MAKEDIKIEVQSRVAEGSKAAGRLRRAGTIPAAINRIKGDTTLVKFNAHTFEGLLRRHTSEQFIVTLVLDGGDIPTLVREVQHDVLKGTAIHVDFCEISLDEEVNVFIPIVLLGEPIGVSEHGGMLEQSAREIEVACLPKDVVEQFEIDTSELGVGESLFVRDLKIGDEYTLLTDEETTVASVIDPAAAAAKSEKEDDEEDVDEDAEGEESGEESDDAEAKKSAD